MNAFMTLCRVGILIGFRLHTIGVSVTSVTIAPVERHGARMLTAISKGSSGDKEVAAIGGGGVDGRVDGAGVAGVGGGGGVRDGVGDGKGGDRSMDATDDVFGGGGGGEDGVGIVAFAGSC